MRLYALALVTTLISAVACDGGSTGSIASSSAASSSSSAPTNLPWRRGVKADGARLRLPPDWITGVTAANRLFAGWKPCRTRWTLIGSKGSDQPTIVSFGAQLEPGREAEFAERARGLASVAGLKTDRVGSWFWASLSGGKPMAARNAFWQRGPLQWIGGLQTVLARPPMSVVVTAESLENTVVERFVVVFSEGSEIANAPKWLKAKKFTVAEDDEEKFVRHVDGVAQSVKVTDHGVFVKVNPPDPSQHGAPCIGAPTAPMTTARAPR